MVLENKDKQLLMNQIAEVLSYSQNIPKEKMTQLPEIIKTWFMNKYELSDQYLGGNLIKEIPNVAFELSKKEREKLLAHFISDITEDEYFWNREETRLDFLKFLNTFDSQFFDNITNKDYICNDENCTIIPAGTKIIKSFKYFIDDAEILRWYQDRASELIQKTKLTGTLCLSVHPLDFLSLSENNYNWRSCHALDGDFRAGDLSYLLDKTTMVCYVKGSDNALLPHFPKTVPWNDKKWRMLLFFSRNHQLIFAGRQYPLFTKSIFPILSQELFGNNSRGIIWEKAKIPDWSPERQVLIHSQMFPITSLVADNNETYHFDDLLHSSVYLYPYYCATPDAHIFLRDFKLYKTPLAEFGNDNLLVEIGEKTTCICCGKQLIDSKCFICDDCNLELELRSDRLKKCCKCGKKFIYGQTEGKGVQVGWNFYCNDCFEDSKTPTLKYLSQETADWAVNNFDDVNWERVRETLHDIHVFNDEINII